MSWRIAMRTTVHTLKHIMLQYKQVNGYRQKKCLSVMVSQIPRTVLISWLKKEKYINKQQWNKIYSQHIFNESVNHKGLLPKRYRTGSYEAIDFDLQIKPNGFIGPDLHWIRFMPSCHRKNSSYIHPGRPFHHKNEMHMHTEKCSFTQLTQIQKMAASKMRPS